MKGEEDIPEHRGEEKELRRGEKKKKKKKKGDRQVCCEIRDSRLFIGAFYRWIIKY
jgi:hypothetical protein